MNRPTVYLAGHVHDDWRARVAGILKTWGYAVTAPHDDVDRVGGLPAEQYMVRDLLAIRQADIVLTWFDLSKPYKYVGTSAECGLAKGLGKILLVAISGAPEPGTSEYAGAASYEFPAGLADRVYPSLDAALDALHSAVERNGWAS